MILAPTLIVLVVFITISFHSAYAEPFLVDDNLVLEKYASLCCGVTTMNFVDDNSLLVLQQNGHVRLIHDGVLQPEPVLIVDTRPVQEMGLLGITSVNSTVYIYHTDNTNSGDIYSYDTDDTGNQNIILNKITKYTWDGQSLTDPILVKELPANLYHNSGAMLTGPDNQVYAVIGDAGRYGPLQNKSLENIYPPGITDYLDTSVILQVEPEGPYHAVGIRNSFGLAIDPQTGIMWITENGDDDFDEINQVPAGFNSGWSHIMGPATPAELESLIGYEDYTYQDPKFSWLRTVAPAALSFIDFKETDAYNDSLFVGACNNSNLYRFQLNSERDGFVFRDPGLQDLLVDRGDSMDEIIIGKEFGCITGMATGPDGYLYLASHVDNNIYRILPAVAVDTAIASDVDVPASPDTLTGDGGGCLIATATFGTELAPQVQLLREIRDEHLLLTQSGASFMSAFNSVYYTFSPAVSDLEREIPLVRHMVKHAITPMIYSLNVMTLADNHSELHTIWLGSLVILLNAGMYVLAPAAVIWAVKAQITKRTTRHTR